jgi:primosomal protein N' (replication factor Y)
LIQTFHPEHYCLKLVAQHDYEGFFEKEIRFRKMMHYPPFTSFGESAGARPESRQSGASH